MAGMLLPMGAAGGYKPKRPVMPGPTMPAFPTFPGPAPTPPKLDAQGREFTPAGASPAQPAGGGGGGGGGGAPNFTNSMQISPAGSSMLEEYRERLRKQGARGADPNLQTQVDRLGQRLSTDTTQRAIDRTSSSIADAAAGRKAAEATRLARRGLSIEEGAGAQEGGRIEAAAERAKAGAAADISLGRERDLDALVLGGQRIMEAPGADEFRRDQAGNQGWLGALGAQGDLERNALGFGDLGLRGYLGGRGLDLQERGQNMAAQDQQMAQWLALMRMFG